MRTPLGLDAAFLVREARERSGLTQRELAARAGTSQSVVARIELGESNPTVATLKRLLTASGLRPLITLQTLERSRPAEPASDGIPERLQRFFRERSVAGVASVYLFGSSARGARHRESDVDVAVLVDGTVYPSRGHRSDLRVRLSAELVTASGSNEVDLLILNDLPPVFARRIVLQGVRLFRSDPQLDHAFVRDVQLRAADLEPFLARMRRTKLERLRE